jgi:hypothetical protein
MKKLEWFERNIVAVDEPRMLPFHLERIAGTIVRLEHKVTGRSDATLSTRLDGKWSVKENIGHLGDVESVGLKRLDEIANGITPMSSAVMPPLHDYNAMTIREVLDYFIRHREATLMKYQGMDDGALQKKSLHPRLKVMMTPASLALFHAEHDDHHLVRISEILKSLPNP